MPEPTWWCPVCKQGIDFDGVAFRLFDAMSPAFCPTCGAEVDAYNGQDAAGRAVLTEGDAPGQTAAAAAGVRQKGGTEP